MKTERLRKLGLILIVLIALGAPELHAAQLSNVTLGRFQDFTVVTLFGDEKMTVTHQIVEAKDGKPHRVVIDLIGAEHGLPQNNFADLPEGTIKSIRTSQFAVSPEPVVRVVLDMAHPAAYRLETPGNNVRVMVSLPGDPPLGKVWAASDAKAAPSSSPAKSPTLASAEPPAAKTDAAKVGAKPASVAPAPLPKRAKTRPLPQAASPKVAKVDPAPAAKSKPEAKSPAKEPVKAAPGGITVTSTHSSSAKSKSLPGVPDTKARAKVAKADNTVPEVPLPMPAKRSDAVIDYNLPIPAALAGAAAAREGSEPASKAETNPAKANPAKSRPVKAKPAPAATKPPVLATSKPAKKSNPAKTEPEPQATDQGSAPVASLTTLPPLKEPSAELVPQRTKVVYHTQGRRDPFLALLQAGGYNAAALPDVNNLRLVGLLHDVEQSWGLFEDANGFGFILRKGDRVKNGRLTKITDNRAFFRLTEFGWSRSVHVDLEPEG